MRLLLGTSSRFGQGAGINAYVEDLSEALLALGHSVHLAGPDPVDSDILKNRGLGFCETDPHAPMPKNVRKLYRYVCDQRIEGVINSDNPVVQCLLPALACPALVVVHLAEYTIGALAAYNQEWADYVIAISSDMQAELVTKHRVPVSKCPVVHNGVFVRGRPIGSGNGAGHTLQVVYSGGYVRRKGADMMVDAVTRFPERWRNVELHWFGHLPRRIKSKLAKFEFIRMRGSVPRAEFMDCLGTSDVLLLPSRSEGCPMAMLEAMSQGVVPVSGDGVGAMRWLITSGAEGYVVPLSVWPDQMTRCLAHLRSNRSTLDSMKVAAYRRFMRDSQMTSTASSLVALLDAPTVRRTERKSETLNLVRWHRPTSPSVVDRLCWEMGVLRSAGQLAVSEV